MPTRRQHQSQFRPLSGDQAERKRPRGGRASRPAKGNLSATSRDPEEWAAATAAARETRRQVAHEVAMNIAEQVETLLVEGDIMGGRALFARRVEQLVSAEKQLAGRRAIARDAGDDPPERDIERAAWMDLSVAAAACAAAIDYVPPKPEAEDDEEP